MTVLTVGAHVGQFRMSANTSQTSAGEATDENAVSSIGVSSAGRGCNLRLRRSGGVASALLVIFGVAVWPMVALNVTLTAIRRFYIVRLLRGRHDSRTRVVEISRTRPT